MEVGSLNSINIVGTPSLFNPFTTALLCRKTLYYYYYYYYDYYHYDYYYL